jgi:hypothetical protein
MKLFNALNPRKNGCWRKSKTLYYQCIETCNYSIQYKDQEDLVVLVPNTVINPNAMMVLHM